MKVIKLEYNWIKVQKISPNKRVQLSEIRDIAMHKKQKLATHNLQDTNINNVLCHQCNKQLHCFSEDIHQTHFLTQS